ncbi:hypothetical protein C9I70_18125 [Pseudomonas aeruginosa]|nr:hypothetical protein C9I70_18125 [Pseudomonas aeruginosa]
MRIPPYFPRLGALALACALALPAQAAERAWSYSYNALGLIERADGPRTDVQDVTLYAYDSRGNLTQVTNALGQVTRLGDYDERSTTCGWTACRWPPSTPTTTPRARSATRPCSTSMATTSTPRAWPPTPAARSPGSGSPTPSAAAKR